jgi:hypothetical protein
VKLNHTDRYRVWRLSNNTTDRSGNPIHDRGGNHIIGIVLDEIKAIKV